ncbi:MAG: DUF6544 family protein [Acidimicrobiales bacterium]
MRWVVFVVLVVHGLVTLLGAAKAFEVVDLPQLTEPIAPAMGVVWLVAGFLILVAAVLMVVGTRWWWAVGALALVVSQVAIASDWVDAKAGTAANVVLLVAVVYGFLSEGPTSYHEAYRRQRDAELAAPAGSAGTVTEAELAHLPGPVATYVRATGAVGRPRVDGFRARIHGRIRSGPDAAWMPFTGEQVNRFGPEPSRVLFMAASMFGVPIDVLHTFTGSAARMRVKAWSLVPMVDAQGEEMTRAETVTQLNDLCVMAPAALVDPRLQWEAIDERSARVTFTRGSVTVAAVLGFDDDGRLVDFVSDDRLRASSDGSTFTPQRWSTPLRDYRSFDGRSLSTAGEGRWHAPDPEGEFAYLEFDIDEITYVEADAATATR